MQKQNGFDSEINHYQLTHALQSIFIEFAAELKSW